MPDLETLAEDFAQIKEAQIKVGKRAETLIPRVLSHFSAWAQSVLLPLLDGKYIDEFTDARYDGENGFIINANIRYADGLVCCFHLTGSAADAVRKYVEQTPWVSRVDGLGLFY